MSDGTKVQKKFFVLISSEMPLNVRLYCYSVNLAKYLSIGLYQFCTNMVFRYRSVRQLNSKKYLSEYYRKQEQN